MEKGSAIRAWGSPKLCWYPNELIFFWQDIPERSFWTHLMNTLRILLEHNSTRWTPKLPQMALSRHPFLSALFILFIREGRPVTDMQYVMPRFTVRLRNYSIKQISGLGFPWLTSTMPVSRRVHTCSRTTSSSWHSRGFPVWPSVLFYKVQALHF